METAIIITLFICTVILGIIVQKQWKKNDGLLNDLASIDYDKQAKEEELEGVSNLLNESRQRESIATNIIADKRKEIDAINAKWETIEQGYKDKIKELNKQLKDKTNGK